MPISSDCDFIARSVPQTLSLDDAAERFQLRKVNGCGYNEYFFEPKDSAAAATTEIQGEKLTRLLKMGASGATGSLQHDLLQSKDFQIFSRGVLGTDTKQSKLHHSLHKAMQLGQGLGKKGSFLKTLDETYWQEALLPKHPSGAETHEMQKQWATSDTPFSFEAWFMKQDPRHHPSSVKYFDDKTRRKYFTTFEEGRLLDSKHKPLDTSTLGSEKPDRSAIYAIFPDLEMYVGPYQLNRIHHSSFNAGKPVVGAGEIKTNPEGTITQISAHSGRYKPCAKQLLNTLQYFERMGADLTQVTLTENYQAESVAPSSAKAFLTINARHGTPTAELLDGEISPHVKMPSPTFFRPVSP